MTLLGTSLLFFLFGWTDDAGKATVLTIGTVVCVAASIAGDISQDLKCGYIIGATPARQQAVELIGAISAAFAVAASILLLGENLVFGSIDLPAPQATLMKTVIEGVLQANLPWGLVLVGASLSLVATLLGIPALPFAVGIYLPEASMMPVFIGGCLRSFTEWRIRKDGKDPDDHTDKGVLLGSGLIAGEGLMGVAVAGYAGIVGARPTGFRPAWLDQWDQLLAAAVFVLIAWFLVRTVRGSRS